MTADLGLSFAPAEQSHAAKPVRESDEIDEYVRQEMVKRRIPGLALAVLSEGKVVRSNGYGLASVELNVRAGRETVFDLASITKPFTATAIMLLVEEGKVGLDVPINTYLAGTPQIWKDITVRNLLSHTGGLANDFWPEFWGYPLIHYPTSRLFEAASKLPLDFSPGTSWQYSDLGYFLLGMIIESVSKKSYDDFLKQRIFEPLGMSRTVVLGQDPRAVVANRASTYTIRDDKLERFRTPYWTAELSPEGGLWSTLEDLAKWDAMFYEEGSVLKNSSIDQMWTPVILNNGSGHGYGLGWFLREHRGRRVIHHSGASGTDFLHLPDEKLTVIVLSNLAGRLSSPYSIALGVAGRYVPELLLSSVTEETENPDPQLTSRLRAMLAAISKGRSDIPLMSQERRARLTSASRRSLAEQLKGLDSFEFTACDRPRKYWADRFGVSVDRVCYYKLSSEAGSLYFWFYLTREGRVADFRVSSQ